MENKSNVKFNIAPPLTFLTTLFVMLKLIGVIHWSWFAVFIPFMILLTFVAFFLIMTIVGLLLVLFGKGKIVVKRK